MAPSVPSPGARRCPAADDLVTAVLTASRVLVGVAATSLAGTEAIVTLAQFRLLVVLDDRGEASLREVADALGTDVSTVVRMADRLTAAGLVNRVGQPVNPRAAALALSRPGAELVWRVTDRRRAAIASIVRRMPDESRAALVAAMHAFADAAGEPHATGPSAFGW